MNDIQWTVLGLTALITLAAYILGRIAGGRTKSEELDRARSAASAYHAQHARTNTRFEGERRFSAQLLETLRDSLAICDSGTRKKIEARVPVKFQTDDGGRHFVTLTGPK